jgi:hypothetical protein
VVIKNNMAFILDYKTGEHQPKYEKQIQNYARIIEQMKYNVSKKILLYIGDELKLIHL